MIRKPLIAGNWKMNKKISEAIELANGIKREVFDLTDRVEVVLCPPFLALAEVAEIISDSDIKLGAQDMFFKESGAYTGEVSAGMLKDVGCSYVIIGHSERRQYFSETNESVNKKLKAALKTDILPILCIGETLAERDAKKTFEVVEVQLKAALDSINNEDMLKITIAYEPVWAIGTGKNATPQEAQEVHKYLRNLILKWYNKEVAGNIRILYGGSIKPDNFKDIIAQEDVDGGLVGGASLETDSFVQLIKLSAYAQ
ncbi:MAG: triose-phosphate isomerase [Candidatus Omnitrophota bacterium]